MPTIDQPLGGHPLRYRLGRDLSELIDEALLARTGRSARTLVKEGPLRVTLIAIGAGGSIAPHHASGPITVHVLSGEILFRAGGDEWRLEPGDLLSLGPGVEHAVRSESGGVFLLTLAAAPEG
ncbi:MAG TPA: cupin domain-containing protein [Longimicrobiales bacterium]